MALAHLTDLAATALGRVLAQYKTLTTRMLPEVEVLVDQVQELEDALWAFWLQLDLDTPPEGVWLDRIGGLIGEDRGGVDDADYAVAIRTRILVNRSNGSIETLIAITEQWLFWFGSPTMTLVDWFPAALTLTINGMALGGTLGDNPTLLRLMKFLTAARAIAVRFDVLYQDADDSLIFVCGDSGGGSVTGLGFDDSTAPDDPSAGRLAGSVLV